MNEKTKQKWIEELGKKKQGMGHLKRYDRSCDDYRYCCIGVLIEVLWPDGYKKSRAMDGLFTFHGKAQILESDAAYPMGLMNPMPLEAVRYMEENFPKIEVGGCILTTLYLLNDGGASFSEIAEFIEKFVETDEFEYHPQRMEDLINE